MLNKEGVLVGCAPIHEALHRLVPQSLRQCLFSLYHPIPLSSLPEQRRMYDTMRKDCYCPCMAIDKYGTVSD